MGLRAIGLVLIIGTTLGCGNSTTSDTTEETRNSDELHRPVDWSAESNLVIRKDTIDDWKPITVISNSLSQPYEGLLNQLWKLSFSGDAKLYAPSILGELDPENPLSPHELVEHLVEYDTSFVENIETGELEESVTKIEFNEGSASALLIYSEVLEIDNEIQLHADAVGLGSKVFDMDGLYRGVKVEFFIDLEEDENSYVSDAQQRIAIESDSLGIFRLSSVTPLRSDGEPFTKLLFEGSSDSEIQRNLTWKFDFKNRKLVAILRKPEPV
ncbi:MAG: hypothetical protein Salg2KO_23130 [Salibacteraceae bacterium]